MKPRRLCTTQFMVSAFALLGVYAVLTFYFFDLELTATLKSKRSAQQDILVVTSKMTDTKQVQDLENSLDDARSAAAPSENASIAVNTTLQKELDDPVRESLHINSSIENKLKTLQKTSNSTNTTHSSPEYKSLEIPDECNWVNFTVKGPPYFLTVVFIVRIYEEDLSKMTSLDLKHWLIYLRYSGVEHVYLYDLWYLPGESQREKLEPFIKEGYLTYEDRHHLNPYKRKKSQLPSYQHCIDKYGNESKWQAAIDIDEYPFSTKDTDQGFLSRFVKRFSENNERASEITMNNFLYLGEKNESTEYLIDKLWRHTHGPSNKLVKPIYKPSAIKSAQVHHNSRRTGTSVTAPSNEMRMNHYWGARLQNWGPDTAETLATTEEDRGMEPIVKVFKKCQKYFSKYLA